MQNNTEFCQQYLQFQVFFKVFLIYPYFTTTFYNFNIIFYHASAEDRTNVFILYIHRHIHRHKKKFKLANLLTNHINYSQTCYFPWIYTIQSHILLFLSGTVLTDILHIFFHPIILSFLPNNRIKFFMTYFHVNQCLRY